MFPELERKLVEMRIRIEMVIGADDRRVAPGVATAEPTLFEHRHIANRVFLRKVVRGRQPMTAAADDDGVVVPLRCWGTPRERPVLVTAERVADEGENRIALHRVTDYQSGPYFGATRSVTGTRASCPFSDGRRAPPEDPIRRSIHHR